jgi:hypothetical protein
MTARPESLTLPEAVDVVEAGEVFEFIADWLAAAGPAVATDLAGRLDPASYPLPALIGDCRRLATLSGPTPHGDDHHP